MTASLRYLTAFLLAMSLVSCAGLSDAERSWCNANRSEVANAYEVTGGPVPQGESEEVRFQTAVDAYLEGSDEPTGVLSIFVLTEDEKAAVDRACEAAYEGR